MSEDKKVLDSYHAFPRDLERLSEIAEETGVSRASLVRWGVKLVILIHGIRPGLADLQALWKQFIASEKEDA